MSDRDLPERLRDLGLRRTADELSDLVARATKERLGLTQILEHVADIEEDDRARRSLERRLQRSKLGRVKPIEDFDWAWPKRIDRDRVEAALRSNSSRRRATSCSSRRRASARR